MPSSTTMMGKRIWFLYLIIGFSKSDVQDLLGLTRGQLDYQIRKNDLSWLTSYAYWSARWSRLQVALELGIVDFVEADAVEVTTLERRMHNWVGEWLAGGAVDWARIDSLSVNPPPVKY